ncbi:MAG: hypothetical protein QG622_2569, partial [Actinomycetota bacterium]|nr:hypothetical protein [Actinomycetota bacterium]
VVVGISLTAFFRTGRSLWRKAVALATEIGVAADRLSAVTDELEALDERDGSTEPAVFADPTELRRERYLSRRPGRPTPRETRPARAAPHPRP